MIKITKYLKDKFVSKKVDIIGLNQTTQGKIGCTVFTRLLD